MGTLNPHCICSLSKESTVTEVQVDNNNDNIESYKTKSAKTPPNLEHNFRIRSAVIDKKQNPPDNPPESAGPSIRNFPVSPKCENILVRLTKHRKSNISISPGRYRKSITRDISTQEETDFSPPLFGLSNSPQINEEHSITSEEEKNIKATLSKHFLFKDMPDDVLQIFLNELFYFTYEKGNVIYEQGDEGNFFYILAEGKIKAVSTTNNITKEKVYAKWSCFGELSLISKSKREETLTSLTKIAFFALDGESFRDIQKRLNEIRLRDRYDFLNTISIFQPLGNIPKYNVALKLKVREFSPNEKIITYGTVGDTLYIIKEGLVSCRIGVKEVRKLSNNDYFGQNSILIDMKRSCDVISLNKAVCYEISREDLKDALGPGYIDVILFSFFQNCVDNSSYFKDLFIESKIIDLFKCFQIHRYNNKERIAERSGKKVMLIIDGSLYKERETYKNYELYASKGDIIGEEIVKDSSKELPKDILAYPDCIAFESDYNNIINILNPNPSQNTNENNKIPLNLLNRIAKLKKLFLFKHLSEKTLEKIASAMQKKKFKAGDVIVEEDSIGELFYLISKGRVRVTIGKKILRDLESGNCFGERALLSSGEKRTATVTAIEDVISYVISKKEFDIILGDKTIKDYMQKKLALQDTSIELKDLHYIKFLGKGKFGNVNLVHNTKNIYAIKAVSKRAVENQKILAKYFVNERRVMLSLDHPFVVKMVKTLKNNLFCFFLMEFIDGKNLDEYISSTSIKKNIDETRFYMASLIIMIEYLQNKYIAHRDIKPSNIMIDSNGYLKMIDFGTAKVLTDYTSTVIGTPHYIAPEILQGKGYSLSCDFWSAGICMYEIFYGMYPFGQYANEVIEIYKDIIHKEFIFPSDNPNYAAVNSLIKDLLTKKVNQRLCNVHLIKERPFFNKFEWDKLIDFKMTPPYKPEKKNFDNVMKINNPFEPMVQEDTTPILKKESQDIPQGYNRKWADEF